MTEYNRREQARIEKLLAEIERLHLIVKQQEAKIERLQAEIELVSK